MNWNLKSLWVLLSIVFMGSIGSLDGALAQSAPPQIAWRYTLDDGAAYGLGISGDGTSLVAVVGFGFDPGGQIISLDPATGQARWAVDTPESAAGDPIIVDGVVYAGMGNLVGGGAAVYALDAATGAELWRTDIENRDLPATPIDAVAFSNGTIYVNRGDAWLYALDAASGDVKWTFDLEKPSRGSAWVDGDTVFVATGFDGAWIYAIDAATGDERWRIDDAMNPVTGPVVSDGLLYVPYVNGEMVAYDPASGEERWRALAGVRDEDGDLDPRPGLPLVHESVLFASSNGFAGAYTVALDAVTGQELWKTNTGGFSAGAPALFGDVLLAGSDTGELLALDPATGSERWRVAVPDKVELDLNQDSPPLVSGSGIYVRDDNGGVVALGVENL